MIKQPPLRNMQKRLCLHIVLRSLVAWKMRPQNNDDFLPESRNGISSRRPFHFILALRQNPPSTSFEFGEFCAENSQQCTSVYTVVTYPVLDCYHHVVRTQGCCGVVVVVHRSSKLPRFGPIRFSWTKLNSFWFSRTKLSWFGFPRPGLSVSGHL